MSYINTIAGPCLTHQPIFKELQAMASLTRSITNVLQRVVQTKKYLKNKTRSHSKTQVLRIHSTPHDYPFPESVCTVPSMCITALKPFSACCAYTGNAQRGLPRRFDPEINNGYARSLGTYGTSKKKSTFAAACRTQEDFIIEEDSHKNSSSMLFSPEIALDERR